MLVPLFVLVQLWMIATWDMSGQDEFIPKLITIRAAHFEEQFV